MKSAGWKEEAGYSANFTHAGDGAWMAERHSCTLVVFIEVGGSRWSDA